MANNKAAATTTAQENKAVLEHDKDTKIVSICKGTDLNCLRTDNKLFVVKKANQSITDAKEREIPKKAIDVLMFDKELGMCFADTGVGKTNFAYQIADAISSGKRIPGIQSEIDKQTLGYFDFELTEKQFEYRYSNNYSDHYVFDDNFYRIELNPEAELPGDFKDFEDYLIHSIEDFVKEYKASFIVIDNITYLKNEQDKAKNALPLMKELNRIKKQYNISILVLAHTPKRDSTRPITVNDIQGSKMLSNFCDSIFAIGQSFQDKSLRYVKQLKQRNIENTYGADNVMVFKVQKPHNFLKFDFIEFSTEAEHLQQHSDFDKEELENQIRNILKAEPGITTYKIAQRLCPNMAKFGSFKVKVWRIVDKINPSLNEQ